MCVFSFFYPFKDPKSNCIPVAMSITSSKILISKYHFHRKGPGLIIEMTYSRTEAEKGQDEPGISCTRKESSQRTIEPCQKDTGFGLKELPKAKFGTI